MHAQVPSQPHLQHHTHPPSTQAQYDTNGIYDNRQQSTSHTNGQSNGVDMNPYQQYAGGYGPTHPYPQPPQQQAPQQQQQQQPQQSGHPHPHHQQQPQQQQGPYMQSSQRLPPLVPGMPQGMPGMHNVRDEPSAPPASSSSANSQQPSQYSMAAPQPQSQMPYQPQPQQTLPPPPTSRAGTSSQSGGKKMSHSGTRAGYTYSLQVVQQPQRARMCGFGDKDRRPITPPPCVRLVIVNDRGTEVDLEEFPGDPSFFVLQVDLWAESADREANVVRASSNSPAVSISSATTTSYPPPAEHPRHMSHDQPMMYINEHGQPMYANMPGYAVAMGRPGMMPQQQYGAPLYYQQMPGPGMPFIQPPQAPSAMYTRNLIGSLTVNAAKLKDNENKQGYWFVLQDLSVRTEGFFRLRMSFIDISNTGGPGVSRGKAPVLAWTFSEKFQVYSAKKFPGVIESTPLSKVFAQQGIKIPIRKDNKNEGGDDDDGD